MPVIYAWMVTAWPLMKLWVWKSISGDALLLQKKLCQEADSWWPPGTWSSMLFWCANKLEVIFSCSKDTIPGSRWHLCQNTIDVANSIDVAYQWDTFLLALDQRSCGTLSMSFWWWNSRGMTLIGYLIDIDREGTSKLRGHFRYFVLCSKCFEWLVLFFVKGLEILSYSQNSIHQTRAN